MIGWIVQIRVEDERGERVTRWAVSHPKWTDALEIASMAQGIDAKHKPAGCRVISIRTRREAYPEELAGLSEGQARAISN